MKLEAKIYLWRKSGEWEKTSGLVSCLLSCFPCCFSSCLLLFFKHSNWSVLSGIFQKPMLTGCSLAKFTYQTKTNTLENIFFKTIFPFTKPVPFQHQYQTKHSENLPVEHFTQCSVLQQNSGLGQSFAKAFFVFSTH